MNAARPVSQPAPHARSIGRYVLYDQIGSGGMATVHFGRLRGPAGFARTVAIKRLHPHLAANPQFASVFVSEARLAARIRHPNVVSLLDVIALESGELLLVMEYVHGETLAALLGSARLRARPLRPALATAIMMGVLDGLHAAHEAVDEGGRALGLVHGDISPRNIIVDVDGCARVLDFGVAKIGPGAAEGLSRLGTPGYMSPEKLSGDRFDRRADVFSAGAVLWEMLCLRRLFPRADRGDQQLSVVPPSTFNPAVPRALDTVVLRALDAQREDRFPTARAFAVELERACAPTGHREVSAWVAATRGGELGRRARALERIETVSVAELVRAAGEAAPRPPEPATPEPGPARPAEAVPAAADAEPTVVGAPEAQDEPPTAVESAAMCWAPLSAPPDAAAGSDQEDTVCEVRPPSRPSRSLPTVTPTMVIEAPVRRSLGERFGARRLPPAARSVLPALALLLVVYAAAAFNGQRVSAPVSAAAAPPPSPLRRAPEAPGHCGPVQPATPAVEREVPAALVAPVAEAPAASRAAQPQGGAAVAIIGLNRRALAAYEQLETGRALRLLSEGLRLCQRAGLRRGDLAALTHLNMGIVLAGGFKQRGLAVKQFQRALAIRPGIEPSGRLLSPDITAAFAEAGAGVRL